MMDHSWSRARYPLQAPLDASPPSSPTDNVRVKSYTAPPQPKNQIDNQYLHQPTAKIYHDAISSIVNSPSPPVGRLPIQPRVPEDDVLSSSTLHSRTEGYTAHPELEFGVPYHMKSTRETTPLPLWADYRLPPSTAPSDGASQQSCRSSQGTPERTLRRTPRSRHIDSPVQPSDNEQTDSRAAAWERHLRNSQSTSSTLSNESREAESKEESSQSAPQSQPSKPQEDGPSASASTPDRETADTAQTLMEKAPSQPAQAIKPKRRGAYPLQESASIMDLRSLPTPPASPTRQDQSNGASEPSEDQSQSGKPASTEIKQLKRQAYPLQSVTNLVEQPHSQSLPESDRKDDQQTSTSPSNTGQENGQVVGSEPLRRQAYPLQDPTAGSNPQAVQTQPKAGSENAQQPVRSDHTRNKKPSRRQAYPLQAPASVMDLRQARMQSIAESEKSTIDGSPSAQSSPTDEQHSQIGPFHRKAYPLQEPANSMSPQQLAAISTSDQSNTTKNHVQKSMSPSSTPAKWQRQGYPLQSPEDVPHDPWDASAHDEHRGEKNEDTKTKLLLPKNIRAVTDTQHDNAKGRTIVVCLDGTGDQFDSDNSNIVHIVSALKKDDPRQVTYYQAGIGTYSQNGLSSGFAAASDMAVGSGLGAHVRDGYKFLMHSYKEGDRICIFGFSRGAYTARCLAGMVHKVGLLPPRNVEQIPFAYKFYKEDTPAGWQQAQDFKKTFCIDVCVYFLGCFDSVASVGVIPRTLPLSSTPTAKPRYFRHAMALDERRAKFKVCRYQQWDWDYEKPDQPNEEHPNLTNEEYSRLMGPDEAAESDSAEVWFAGAHADVGGGAVKNVVRHKLAQIPLRWMIRQAFECNTGIIFQTRTLAEHGLDVHTLWPKYEQLKIPSHGPPPSFRRRYEKELPPRSTRRRKLVATDRHESGEQLYQLQSHMDEDWTPEQVEDFYDSLMPMNDQLVDAPTWWILEAWPVEYKTPVGQGKVVTRIAMNMGSYRAAEEPVPKMHWTVTHRMAQIGYKLGVRAAPGVKWQSVI